ncbi:hypothetical protein F5Y12DRAFT_105332 [Xylaria sp. FL1777]|nr:hypothetical protein F5Y12DRAFT_105332 [Xylaria sp. FL1777]
MNIAGQFLWKTRTAISQVYNLALPLQLRLARPVSPTANRQQCDDHVTVIWGVKEWATERQVLGLYFLNGVAFNVYATMTKHVLHQRNVEDIFKYHHNKSFAITSMNHDGLDQPRKLGRIGWLHSERFQRTVRSLIRGQFCVVFFGRRPKNDCNIHTRHHMQGSVSRQVRYIWSHQWIMTNACTIRTFTGTGPHVPTTPATRRVDIRMTAPTK